MKVLGGANCSRTIRAPLYRRLPSTSLFILRLMSEPEFNQAAHGIRAARFLKARPGFNLIDQAGGKPRSYHRVFALSPKGALLGYYLS